MSHRERCMSGVFSRILGHLGLIKDNHPPSKVSSEPQPLPTSDSFPCEEPPSSNKKTQDCTHIGTFNVVFNKDVSPADKAAEKKLPTGFRVRVSVPVCHEPFTPVVIECTPGSGGVQGLQWYSEKLMVDEDGDVAQEFLDEVTSQASGPQVGYNRLLPSFRLKLKTRPAKLKGSMCTYDGNVVQIVEPFMSTKQKS
ncbi:hypothetical protein GOP47_0002704 [Adiantum capillus-veneris]|uniref:Uncharacterized protein n=1 Tax=Adiantum capillus-veneris TaxID=13818 RepID=A0A9D4ZR65_ADICA|nr:hypothetical protein GOP47_0002704 [Adiantum capillus-veneris]